METNLQWKSQLFHPLSPIFNKGRSSGNNFHILLNKAQSQTPVSISRKKRRRNGTQRVVKFMLESIPIVASKLKILPQPLDMILGELSGGDGNGSGGWGFGRFSGDGWFDGWRRRGTRRKLGFWWIVLVFGLGLILGREIESDLMYRVMGFGLISCGLIEIWSRKAIRDLMLGICCVGAMAVLVLRPEVKNRVREVRVWPPLKKSFWGRRKGRKAL